MYFRHLTFICAGYIFLIAAKGTELSNDVFITPIGVVVADILAVVDEV